MFNHLPQSNAAANNNSIGIQIINSGKKRLLKNEKRITFFFNWELKYKIKSGPKPIKIIKKYLKNTVKESLSIVGINCDLTDDWDSKVAQET